MMEDEEDVSRTGNQSENKKHRRVSFSDITSVRFFDKDEDNETSPEIKHTPTPQKQEQDFFGPLSLWNLNSASDESPLENDVTLDASEFSQNFMKLLGEHRHNVTQVGNTPTGESSETLSEKSMTLTGNVPKPNLQTLPIQIALDKENAGDMSLTGDNYNEYKFASISPHLVSVMRNEDTQAGSNALQVNKTSCNGATRPLEEGNDGLKPKNPVNKSYTEGASADHEWKEPTISGREFIASRTHQVPRKFFIGAHEFRLPVTAKPRTLQECLRFMYATRPQVCLLEDAVKQLQKDVANFNTLSSTKKQIMHWKNLQLVEDNSSLPENFRMGYIRWLQQMLAYEKSKSQLLLAKRDELKTTIQKLQLGSQEVENLKAKAFCLDKKVMFKKDDECSILEAATEGEEKAYIKLLEVDIEKQMKLFASKKADSKRILKEIQKENQDTYEKVIIMKQELDTLDYKIRDLCEFYCAFCTSKDNVSMKNVVQFIEGYVKNVMKNHLILQDILLWKLKEIKIKPGEHFIELNYLDIISHRFQIAGDGPLAKAATSYNLSYEIVERDFPNMNASMAFSAVFASKESLKTVDVKSIWQTIQETRFLFGNLIDVLQEIQLCCTKLQNLSSACFHCVNGSDLQLHLTFLKSICGLRVVVAFDMQHLKYGIYPSDVLPFQVELVQHGQQSGCLLAAVRIEESVKSMAPGYTRLTMLCDCISNLIECAIQDTRNTLTQGV